jgi:hypothetical protein
LTIFLFLKIKEILEGRHFDEIDDIRSNTTTALECHSTKPVQKLF